MDYHRHSNRVRHHLSRKFDLPDEQIELMLPEFKKALLQHMKGLRTAQQQGDPDALAEAAHRIKGALLNLGLEDCAELARKIEIGSGARDTAVDYASFINTIGTIVNEFIKEQ